MKNQSTQPAHPSSNPALPSKPDLLSFHHLLFDRLMPWLPFNGDAMVFRTLEQHMDGRQHPFFDGLADRLQALGIVDDPLLRAEWDMFTKLVPDTRWLTIYKSIDKNLTADARTHFFQQYILQSMLFTGSLLTRVMEQSSPPTQQFVLSSFMKRLKDFQNRCHEFYEADNEGVAPVLFLLSGVLFVMENEIVKRYKPLLNKKYLSMRFTPLMQDAMPQTHNRQMVVHFHLWLQKTYPVLPPAAGLAQQQPQQRQVPEPAAMRSSPERQTTKQQLPAETEGGASKLLSSAEASAMLDITKKTLLEHAKKGKVAYIHIGKLYKFRQADIEAFRQKKDQPHT